jgi:hypothetical protein
MIITQGYGEESTGGFLVDFSVEVDVPGICEVSVEADDTLDVEVEVE